MNLKSFLADTGKCVRLPAITVPAPELGLDVCVPVALLTIGEMKACQAIREDKSGNSLTQLQSVLAIVIVDDDGKKVYSDGDADLDLIPAPLAFRLIDAAMTAAANASKVDAAKKPSPPTPN